MLLAGVLLAACVDTRTYYVRGTLYSDSTLSTPLIGHDINFVGEYDDTLGTVRTDSLGHFGFAFNPGIDPIVRRNSKFVVVYPYLFVIHQGDTLYGCEYPRIEDENLVLYPGCWVGRGYWL